jgi:predicted  nucleic acid-binding Zn-ribbon protein
LKKTIQSQSDHLNLLQEEIKDLNLQFQEYKIKATSVFKTAKLLTPATLSKAVQYHCDDISDYTQNIKTLEENFSKESERYKIELQETLKTLENRIVEIKDLERIIQSWKEENETLRELLSKEKVLRQKLVEEYDLEKKQFEEQLTFNKSRIEKVCSNIVTNLRD